jgi:hypothetical protein
MSRIASIVSLLLLASLLASARHHHAESDQPAVFQVGGLQFSIPATWQAEPIEGPARVGQWIISPPRINAAPAAGDGIEIVAIFFGPGIGGSAQENFDAWAGTIATSDGTPAKATPQKRTVTGHAISEVQFSGTYAQVNPQPGLPPTLKQGYSLIGAVVENPAGRIYWRVTGPAAQVMAFAPVFDQMLNSLKPQAVP